MYEELNRAFQVGLDDGLPLPFGPRYPSAAASADTYEAAASHVQNLLRGFDDDCSDDVAIEHESIIDVGAGVIHEEFINILHVDYKRATAILDSLRGNYDRFAEACVVTVKGKRTATLAGLQDRAQKRAKVLCVTAFDLAIIPPLLP